MIFLIQVEKTKRILIKTRQNASACLPVVFFSSHDSSGMVLWNFRWSYDGLDNVNVSENKQYYFILSLNIL